MKIFPKEVSLRAEVGKAYSELFEKIALDIQLPHIRKDCNSVFAQFTIQVSEREKIIDGFENPKTGKIKVSQDSGLFAIFMTLLGIEKNLKLVEIPVIFKKRIGISKPPRLSTAFNSARITV